MKIFLRSLLLLFLPVSAMAISGGTEVLQGDASLTIGSVTMTTNGQGIVFGDGSIQTTAASGSGGGSSSLAVFKDGVQVTSPTSQINVFGKDFLATAHGTTAYLALNPATTDFIHNQNTLQAGSTAFSDFSYVGTSQTVHGPQSVEGTINSALNNFVNQSGGGYWLGGLNSFQSGVHSTTGGSLQLRTFNGDEYDQDPNGAITMYSSVTVLGAGGFDTQYGVTAGSVTGAGLTTCGDSTHGLGWSAGTFSCQNFTGASPGSPVHSVQFNNAGAFGGSSKFNWSGSSVTIISSASISDDGTQGNTNALLDIYGDQFPSAGGSLLASFGTENFADQVTITDKQPLFSTYGAQLNTFYIGTIANGNTSIVSNQNANNFINFWDSGAMRFRTGAGPTPDMIFEPGTAESLRLNTVSGALFTSSVTVKSPSGEIVNYGLTTGSATISNLASGQCVQTGAGGILTVTGSACSTGGSGSASTLAVTTGTASTYSNPAISSPTAVIAFLQTQFNETASGTTAYLSINTSSITAQGPLPTLLGTVTTGVWSATRLVAAEIPTDVAYIDVDNNWSHAQTSPSSWTITAPGGLNVKYNITAGTITTPSLQVQTSSVTILGASGLTVNSLTASLPVQTDANLKLVSSAIDLSGTQATGVLAAGRFPALTGDVTTSAGALATTAAASQTHITQFTQPITMTSSLTITGAGGETLTYGVKTATAQITGLGTNTNVCTDGSSNLTTSGCSNGTVTGPATPVNSVQFNNAGAFGGSGNFNWSGSSMSVLASGGIWDTYGLVVGSMTTTGPVQTGNLTAISSETITAGGLGVIATGNTPSFIASFSTSSIGTPLVSISTIPAVVPSDYELTLTSAATNIMVIGIQADGHIVSSGTTPSMGTCGSSPSIVGTDTAGMITVGGGVVTSCTMNFANAWANAPVCTESDNSTSVTADISSISTTAITFGFSATLGGGNVWFICVGQKG